jgi:hypothetical protein
MQLFALFLLLTSVFATGTENFSGPINQSGGGNT